MCPDDDETNRPETEYIPPKSQNVERRGDSPNLPDIPLPSTGILKSAFLTAVRYRGTAAAVAAYTNAVRQSVEAVQALADLDRAAVEQERARHLLEDAETVHAKDRAKRREKFLKAEQSMREVEAKAKKADIKRVREASRLEAEHQRWKEGGSEQASSIGVDDLSESQKEYYDELKAVAFGDKLDVVVQIIIDEFLQGRSEQQLSSAERERLNHIRTTANDLIQSRKPIE